MIHKIIKRVFLILIISICYAYAQSPFLETRPYVKPDFIQYDIKNHVDHHHPTSNLVDGVFSRFDGVDLVDNLMFPDCIQGSSCYDGHAGVDYYMEAGTPIIAPANGYVIWSAFSPGADPCPGGISPNGDTGMIILAHPGTDYFSCYLHLEPPLNVSVGESVETGDTLGFAGNTGCAQSPHLHFEIRKGSYGFDEENSYAVDPFGWWGSEVDPIESLRGNSSDWLWKSSWVIDDNDNGFQRYYGPNWDRYSVGFENDCWVAPPTMDQENSRHYAIWVPELNESGLYDIEVYIPDGLDAVTSAVYEIYVKNEDGSNEKVIVPFNQALNSGGFKAIATIELPAGSNCSVILRDYVDESSTGSLVVFDAVRFISSGTVGIDDESIFPRKQNLYINKVYPNPFNPAIAIDYGISVASEVSIFITDLNGKRIKTFNTQNKIMGEYIQYWKGDNDNGEKVSAGLYLLSIKAANNIKTAKLLFLK